MVTANTNMSHLLSSLKILLFRIHVGKQKVGVFPKGINQNVGQIKLVHVEAWNGLEWKGH